MGKGGRGQIEDKEKNMPIDPTKVMRDAMKAGELSAGDDGLPVIRSGEAEIKLVESDPKHAGFDAVEIAVGSEVQKYSWQSSPGLFKRLNDFVEHKKAVASGGATSELGEKRERRVHQLQLGPPSSKARDRAEAVMDLQDVMGRYIRFSKEQAGFGEELLEDMRQCRNPDKMSELRSEMQTVVHNFFEIRDAVANHAACSSGACGNFLMNIDNAIRYFRQRS